MPLLTPLKLVRSCGVVLSFCLFAVLLQSVASANETPPDFARDVLPILKNKCVKCHGPAKQEAGLDLSQLGKIAIGGESGPAILPGKVEKSLLWQKVNEDEMPEDRPLPAKEKAVLRRWIASGAIELAKALKVNAQKKSGPGGEHWAFGRPRDPRPPEVVHKDRVRSPIDRFLLHKLEAKSLTYAGDVDRRTLIRRVSFGLTGLPPSPEEIEMFEADHAAGADQRMVDRYIGSPRYGERWARHWLDTSGYADSNGYFSADSDRPLAYRYRDYVIRSLNQDKPLDEFVREQLAGDELSGYSPDKEVTPRMFDQLVATHYLRNSQDGTGESDGNPDEVRVDRYMVIEGTMHMVGSHLMGLKLRCARCHDHKFESISQKEYYQFQATFYPAFNITRWVTPNNRVISGASQEQLANWKNHNGRIEKQVAKLRDDFSAWVRKNRPPAVVLLDDTFDGDAAKLAARWTNTVSGDSQTAGKPGVNVDSSTAPGAITKDGNLQILESGATGDRVLVTKQGFDWTPNKQGAWISASFDLVSDRAGDSVAAQRIGYLIALRDFNDQQETGGGNILLDGNPTGGAAVHLDYPGKDAEPRGVIGSGKYRPGHNFGVRVTNLGDGKYRLEHLVDGVAEKKAITLASADLPEGPFGFEYCCRRSFIVDNVRIETSPGTDNANSMLVQQEKVFQQELLARRERMEKEIAGLKKTRTSEPGKIAWLTDGSTDPPNVYILKRGDYKSPGDKVIPGALAILDEPTNRFDLKSAAKASPRTTGRRLALARWLTRPDSRASALMARVLVNRVWQRHFGVGIVSTSDNLGMSGAAPSHQKLLDYLATGLARNDWSLKWLNREILSSTAYRQSSAMDRKSRQKDAGNRLLSRFPLRRLDADPLRDAMLAVTGDLDQRMGGRYVPTRRDGVGAVIIASNTPGENRRGIYLQQRRTQVLSMMRVFDAPLIVASCSRRGSTTVPLQSLSLLNSAFVRSRASALASSLMKEPAVKEAARLQRAFELVYGRSPRREESRFATDFLKVQTKTYADKKNASSLAWADLCQMLLASNAFLYVE